MISIKLVGKAQGDLIAVNAGLRLSCHEQLFNRESKMTTAEMGMLTLIVCALGLFGGALAWASWQETRQRRRTGE